MRDIPRITVYGQRYIKNLLNRNKHPTDYVFGDELDHGARSGGGRGGSGGEVCSYGCPLNLHPGTGVNVKKLRGQKITKTPVYLRIAGQL